jgi:O-antigen ligase
MLRWMNSKNWLAAALIALPWLMGATPGFAAQMGAWMAASAVLVGLLFCQSARSWPPSLVVASGLSWCIAMLQFSGLAAGLAPWVSESVTGEMVANLRQRNQFATLMAIGALAVWLRYLNFSGRFQLNEDLSAQEDFKLRLFLSTGVLLVVAVLAFATALSGSRTGLLHWLALLALALSWQRSWARKTKWVLGAVLLGYGLGARLGPWAAQMAGHANIGLLGRVAASDEQSRLALWSNVLELMAREPWLGHGWRSLAYAHYSAELSSQRFMEMLDNAHNLPLHLAVELGIPVALGFCGLVLWLIWKNKPWAETRADRQLAWGILMMIGIHSMVEYPLWYGPFFMTAVIAVGILCADVWRAWLLAQTQSAQQAVLWGIRSFAVLLLAGTAFAAFDYHRVSQIYLQPEERSAWYKADPLAAAKKSVLFQSHAKFAELQITPLTRETAPRVLELSSELVMWSPEPRIIEKLIESAVMMQVDDLAGFHIKRYKVAYPQAYAVWSARVS